MQARTKGPRCTDRNAAPKPGFSITIFGIEYNAWDFFALCCTACVGLMALMVFCFGCGVIASW